jgi:hypothetical protein
MGGQVIHFFSCMAERLESSHKYLMSRGTWDVHVFGVSFINIIKNNILHKLTCNGSNVEGYLVVTVIGNHY